MYVPVYYYLLCVRACVRACMRACVSFYVKLYSSLESFESSLTKEYFLLIVSSTIADI